MIVVPFDRRLSANDAQQRRRQQMRQHTLDLTSASEGLSVSVSTVRQLWGLRPL